MTDVQAYMDAVWLGLLEGITEFIPVSSTGHLLLLKQALQFHCSDAFEIVIQFGAILAVVLVYFQRLWRVLITSLHDKGSQRFIFAVLLAFLPSMMIGAFAHSFIKSVLFNPIVVSISLIVGGIAILWIEKKGPVARIHDIETMPLPTALKIGFVQCIAMIPGVSRSGATIMGSMLMGVDRKTAAEFSFFLAIPTMAAATAYDLYKNANVLTQDDITLIAIGFVTAFLSSLVVIKLFVGFVSRHGFAPFAWYRIAAGILALTLLLGAQGS